MYKLDLLRLDPLAHLLILAVIALQIYATFVRPPDAAGVTERDLLEATLAACSR